jgi:S1-C subfamily serine protease
MRTEEQMWVPPSPPQLVEAPPPPRRPRAFLVAMLAGLLGAGIGTSATLAVVDPDGASIVEQATPTTADGVELKGVAAVAAKLGPSIVRVDVGAAGPFGGTSSGTGSGVIFTSDGYILTNEHVVEGAREIEVTLANGDTLPARLIGSAAPTDDIAVIKVDREGLDAATLGSTADVNVGDVAVAVGSPYGLQGTVTAGVISALHRNINLGGSTLTDAIQTDAPINPGNSGGALADANGNVIGINTAIVGATGGNTGVGFAIPIDIAKRDAEQIIETGHASRPYLGISGANAPDAGGALVQDVGAGSPAARAGLRTGDVITSLGGKDVRSMDELVSRLYTYDVGDRVPMAFERDGRARTVTVTLGSTGS